VPSLLATPRIAVHVEDHLAAIGNVFATIRGHDSGCTSYGVEDGGDRWFVKVAYDADVDQLRSAERFHAAVAHPAIVPLLHAFDVPGGRAVVYPWVAGEILNDPLAPGGRPRTATDSALNRFRARPVGSIERVLDTLIDAHVAVVGAGFVAVDFYDGCLMYDAATEQVRLVDLDGYRPGPYVLEADRQYGSRRFMAPEEFVRGSTLDERTTVYTLGRTARVLLGEAGHWRGSAASERVVDRATADAPADRFGSVDAFAAAWFDSRS
jgi:serine/threonine protein kinase